MELIWKACPNEDVMNRFKEIERKEADEYVSKWVLMRSSSILVEFHRQGKWVGYAVLELLESLNLGSILDDIDEEDVFEKCKDYVENQLIGGYYLHTFRMFDEYQGKGFGTQAEKLLMKELKCPILLYTVSESEYFWGIQGYQSLDGEYYLYKEVSEDMEIAI